METPNAEVVTEQPSTPAPEAPATPVEKPTPAAAPVEKPSPTDRRAVLKHQLEEAKAGRKPEALPQPAKNAAGRQIDPATGKYVATKPADAPKVPVAAAPAAPVVMAQPQAPTAPVEALNVPAALKAHLKTKWAELGKEWQEEFSRMERSMLDAGNKFAPQVNAYKQYQAVVAPYEQMLNAAGRQPLEAIASMLQAEAIMRMGTPQQKTALFQHYARMYGVELGQPQQQQFDQQGLPVQAQHIDIANHPVVQQLMGQVNQFSQHFQQQQQAQAREDEQRRLTAIESFLGEKEANGTPKYPLDDSLEDAFAAEIGLVRQVNPDWDHRRVLEAAHTNLAWKTPELREVMLQKQASEKQAKQQAELAAKKAAAVQVKGGPASSVPPAVDPKNRRAVIKDAFNRIGRAAS